MLRRIGVPINKTVGRPETIKMALIHCHAYDAWSCWTACCGDCSAGYRKWFSIDMCQAFQPPPQVGALESDLILELSSFAEMCSAMFCWIFLDGRLYLQQLGEACNLLFNGKYDPHWGRRYLDVSSMAAVKSEGMCEMMISAAYACSSGDSSLAYIGVAGIAPFVAAWTIQSGQIWTDLDGSTFYI